MSEVTGPRERILEVTLAILDSEGEGGLKIDTVAETAHVAKQSIYHHFHDREGLIIAAQAERYRRGMAFGAQSILDAVLRCVDADDFFRVIVGAGILAVRDGAERRRDRIHSLGSASARPELQLAIRAAHHAAIVDVERILAFGQTRGWVKTTHSAATLSEAWFSIITGFHVSEVYASDPDPTLAGTAIIDALTLLLFGRTFPELTSTGL